MARFKIITLGRVSDRSLRVALWLDVPNGASVFFTTPSKSQWNLATDEDNAAISTGAVMEEVIFIDPQVPNYQGELEVQWTRAQNTLNETAKAWEMYGITWDGKIWSDTTVKVADVPVLVEPVAAAIADALAGPG